MRFLGGRVCVFLILIDISRWLSRNTSDFHWQWENFSIIPTSNKSLPLFLISAWDMTVSNNLQSIICISLSVRLNIFSYVCWQFGFALQWIAFHILCYFSCGIVSVCQFVRARCIAWTLTFVICTESVFSGLWFSTNL